VPSGSLAQGTAHGQATGAIERAKSQLNLPAAISTSFQGNAQAFQGSLSTVPVLILAALVVVYIILGILYESFIHAITILSTLPSASVGRSRRFRSNGSRASRWRETIEGYANNNPMSGALVWFQVKAHSPLTPWC
jgi:hypothetical protein